MPPAIQEQAIYIPVNEDAPQGDANQVLDQNNQELIPRAENAAINAVNPRNDSVVRRLPKIMCYGCRELYYNPKTLTKLECGHYACKKCIFWNHDCKKCTFEEPDVGECSRHALPLDWVCRTCWASLCLECMSPVHSCLFRKERDIKTVKEMVNDLKIRYYNLKDETTNYIASVREYFQNVLFGLQTQETQCNRLSQLSETYSDYQVFAGAVEAIRFEIIWTNSLMRQLTRLEFIFQNNFCEELLEYRLNKLVENIGENGSLFTNCTGLNLSLQESMQYRQSLIDNLLSTQTSNGEFSNVSNMQLHSDDYAPS